MVTKKIKKITKKTSTKKASMKKGSKYSCSVCGLVVSIDEVCGCVDVCDLICCNEPMKPKKTSKTKK